MTIPIMYNQHQGQPVQELEGQQDAAQLFKYGHPAMYGGAMDGDAIVKPPFFNWRRRRLNLIAIAISFFVPWLLFCFVFWILSFKLFFRSPALCIIITFLAFCFVVFLGTKALESLKRRYSGDWLEYESTWYVFLFVTSLLAWGVACYAGWHNFHYRMDAYYNIENLGMYNGVDPFVNHGQQIMDAGRVVFKEGVHLDLSKSMSFRNNDLYCVAPIVTANHSFAGAPPSYDFWAVGLNCCCGDSVRTANFQCGEFNNPEATAGLRLMRDEDRPFYRLAVQQAVGAFGIRATHPLFFHWVQDPVSAAESYRWEGHRQYLIGVYIYFVFQLFLVCITTMCFATKEDEHARL